VSSASEGAVTRAGDDVGAAVVTETASVR
jgi:hypothetical protein